MTPKSCRCCQISWQTDMPGFKLFSANLRLFRYHGLFCLCTNCREFKFLLFKLYSMGYNFVHKVGKKISVYVHQAGLWRVNYYSWSLNNVESTLRCAYWRMDLKNGEEIEIYSYSYWGWLLKLNSYLVISLCNRSVV